MKQKRLYFIIVRVTKQEKDRVIKQAQVIKKRLSSYVRNVLGLN